jgi:ABC-type transporter MlaC component
MLISTVVFLFFLFLIYALFLLSSRKSDARQVRMQKRVAEALQDFDSQEQQIHISRQDSIGGHPTIESCRHWTS